MPDFSPSLRGDKISPREIRHHRLEILLVKHLIVDHHFEEDVSRVRIKGITESPLSYRHHPERLTFELDGAGCCDPRQRTGRLSDQRVCLCCGIPQIGKNPELPARPEYRDALIRSLGLSPTGSTEFTIISGSKMDITSVPDGSLQPEEPLLLSCV